jgi:hypothetical protein
VSNGIILGIDVARLMGVAEGEPDGRPMSYLWTLSKPRDGQPAQFKALVARLNHRFRQDPRPVLVMKEAAFSLASFRDHGVSEEVVRSAFGMHAIIEGMCGVYGIPCRDVNVATATKHFTGKSRHGGRAARKAAVITRCKQLGYVAPDCIDDNICDALAVWDYAAHVFGRRQPREIVMFQEAEPCS